SVGVCAHCTVARVFFFQAEDGIRDDLVTGVQTCALPIYLKAAAGFQIAEQAVHLGVAIQTCQLLADIVSEEFDFGSSDRFGVMRSEERRVGKEWRSRTWTVQEKKKLRCRRRIEVQTKRNR